MYTHERPTVGQIDPRLFGGLKVIVIEGEAERWLKLPAWKVLNLLAKGEPVLFFNGRPVRREDVTGAS